MRRGIVNRKEVIKYWKMVQEADIPDELKKAALAILEKEE